jgi:hypothetical protein
MDAKKHFSRVEWILITDIIGIWGSCDSSSILPYNEVALNAEEWQKLLEYKREYRYEKAMIFLKNEGFNEPLCYYINAKGENIQSNGHHRLTAAHDLGYKYVPYIHSEFGETFYNEKFNWEGYDFSHPENPKPEIPNDEN